MMKIRSFALSFCILPLLLSMYFAPLRIQFLRTPFSVFAPSFCSNPVGISRVSFRQLVLDPVTWAIEEQKVAVMDETVNHGSSHLLIVDDVYPSAEFQVRGDNHAPLLVAISSNLKQ